MVAFTSVLFLAVLRMASAASDTQLEDPGALSLIQGHARKIIKKSKAGKAASLAEMTAADALADTDAGGLSLIQGSQNRISAHGLCENTKGARRVSKRAKADPAMLAAVTDGVEDSMAALALYQKSHGTRLKADGCLDSRVEGQDSEDGWPKS
eukprot:TRINITY_DN4567_c0_g1_i1.p1 TRINITY_DN4567_c0_g1~~TRINITY_DN4567_c0_g1_i1.p1  ORF type:complete len:153 (+),score=34.27 TRINITY_DN4567_c0_g1_i1:130-588(+)